MGKTEKWIKNLFTGKEDKEKKPSSQAYSLTVSEIFTGSASVGNPVPPPPESPKGKQGLSFRRSPPRVPTGRPADHAVLESRIEQKKALAAATAKLVGAVAYRRGRAVEEAAAVMIQSVFRSYLARKALKALRGLVKVQALVRGYLVRKQTTATLHCMQSLATAQARARSQRIRMADESNSSYRIQSNHRKAMDRRSKKSIYQEIDRGMDGNIRIVKMDVGESKQSTNSRKSRSSHPQTAQTNYRTSKGSVTNRTYSKQERRDLSVKPSALIDSSPRARSMRFDDYYFDTAQSSPQYSSAASMSEYPSNAQTYHRVVDSSPRAESRRFDDYYLDTAQSSPHASSTSSKPEYPSYDYNMTAPAYVTNTESLRAKGERSQGATWARPDSTAGMSSRKKAPRAGTRPDSNVDPWLAKHARVGGSTGKERDYGSSRTGHTITVNGKPRSSWK